MHYRQDFEDPQGALNRRGTDPVVEMVLHKVTKMEAAMDKVADALTKLAIVEERQNADRAALERAFAAIQKSDERCAETLDRVMAKIEKNDARLDQLEQAAPMQQQVAKWVTTALWAAAAAATMYVAKHAGLVG